MIDNEVNLISTDEIENGDYFSWKGLASYNFCEKENHVFLSPRCSGQTSLISDILIRIIKNHKNKPVTYVVFSNYVSFGIIGSNLMEELLVKESSSSFIQCIKNVSIRRCDNAYIDTLHGKDIDHIFIDSANVLSNRSLLAIIDICSTKNCCYTALGCDNNKVRGKKNIWKWMINNPDIKVTEIYYEDDYEKNLAKFYLSPIAMKNELLMKLPDIYKIKK